jgi:hypothetical protein
MPMNFPSGCRDINYWISYYILTTEGFIGHVAQERSQLHVVHEIQELRSVQHIHERPHIPLI